MNLHELYGQAVEFHQRGNLAEAERRYLQILSADPSGFAPNYMLGVLRVQQNRYPEALDLMATALKAQPDMPAALVNYANVLCALGRPIEAMTSYDRALKVKPDYPEAYYRRGLALSGLNRHEEALASYDRALGFRPDYAEAWRGRAVTLCGLSRFEDALASYDKALAFHPGDAEAWYNRGRALQDLKRFEDAVASYDKALAIMPDNVHAMCNRGVCLAELGRFPQALENYDKALALQPDYVEALYNRGLAFSELKRPAEAVADYDKALAIRTDFALAMGNRAIALQHLNRFDDALAGFDRAIAADPGHAKSHLDKGYCQLLLGQFEEGWRLQEWRKKLPESGAYRAYPQPLWTGAEDLRGKVLYIYAEQALGDTIQFCRYAALAEARGGHVVLSVQNALMRLIKTLSPTIEIRGIDDAPSEFDYHIPLLSMPLAFQTDWNNFPHQTPYLRAEAERVQSWAGKIGGEGFKIGIAWQGNKAAKAYAGRSFPVALFEAIAKIPRVRLISLQKKDGVEQLAGLPSGMTVETPGDGFDEGADAFIDTAAVMENLDLIVTPDTALAHLAGALDRPVWTALKSLPDWRWFLNRFDSPWYPTMRLFRQQTDGDWADVFAQMELALKNRQP